MRKYTRTTRKKRGGNGGPIQGTSASSYVLNNYGATSNAQVQRVNENYSDIVATKSNFLPPEWFPTLGSKGLIANLGQYMSGGKSKRSHKKKTHTKKKGGFFYEVIKQAVVPFTLLAMSDSFTRKTMYKKKRNNKRKK